MGIFVVGNDDPQSGTGETASQTLDFILNIGADSDLYGKIDKNNIGIMGYSQGGAGALCAVTNFDNGKLYKTIFTGSAAYPFLAHNMGWDYDVSKVTIPYFMTSGTGKTDDADVLILRRILRVYALSKQLSRIITVFLMMWRRFGQGPQVQSMRLCLFVPTVI